MTATDRGVLWLPALSLCQRELVRFLRQRSRVLGSLAAPVLLWFLVGAGAGTSFRPPGAPPDMGYLEYFFPGTLVLILLFTAIFSTISIIEDRNMGFLQAVLAAPVPRTTIVAGKVAGGALLALLHALPVLLLARAAGVPLTWRGVALVVPIMGLLGIGLTAMGFYIAWGMESVQGFHAIMNLALMPMWFLSGALFPPSGSAGWVRVLIYANPLTYGVGAMRQALYTGGAVPGASGPPLWLNLTVVGLATVAMCVVTVRRASRPSPEGV